jgi:hypothetical protein
VAEAADAIRRAVQATDAQLWDRLLFFRLYQLAPSNQLSRTVSPLSLASGVRSARTPGLTDAHTHTPCRAR